MVTSDNGKSVHDETQEYEDADTVDDVGLDSGGFDSNPKQVSGTEKVSVDKSGYGLRDRDYSHGDFGFFGPGEEVFEVFSAVMDAPAEELEEDGRPVTDGGKPRMAGPMGPGTVGPSTEYGAKESSYEDQEAFTDGGGPTMADVDHEGPRR